MHTRRRVHNGLWLVAGVALAGVVLAGITGCSSAAEPGPAASASATVLPYGIPLPGDASLVEKVTPSNPNGDVTGWSAAATSTTGVSEIVTDYLTWAKEQGWTTTSATTGATTTITARRSALSDTNAQQAKPRPESGVWLQISVTQAGPDVGTFVGFRAADVPR